MTKDARKIVGDKRSNGKRDKDDYYVTPKPAIKALLEREKFNKQVWEPACGDGAISKELENYGYSVFSSDLYDREYGIGGVDFLQDNMEGKVMGNFDIITNPPYKKALEFVRQAKELAKQKIALLLKTTFLESQKRYSMFQDKQFPLQKMYQFSKRISMYKKSEENKGGGIVAYAWFIWNKNYSGKPQIEWILTD